jgi:hypothetical protein
MKTNFKSVSSLFWVTIGAVMWNLLYSDSFKGTVDTDHIIYFLLVSSAVYSIGVIVYLQLNKKYKNISIDIHNEEERTYYESKFQYYLITVIALVFFSIATLFDIGGFSDMTIYFTGISFFAVLFVCFYRTSSFVLNRDTFVWKKGDLKIECPWTDVISIHHDVEPALSNVGRKFTSTSFFIETKSGFTKYADLTNIKIKGSYTVFSQGNILVDEILLKSNASVKVGEVSMFKQTQKPKAVVLLLLAIFIVPVLITFLYNVLTGYRF